jgi:lysine-N-methylase
MKTTHSIDALIPEVNSDFQCLGSDCPDTCCSGWQVNIDKDSFFEYKNNTNPELKDLFLNSIQREKNATAHRYGTIRLNQKDNSCGFLDQGLCKIQKTLGENALSDTCSGYPRITLQHGDMIQQGLTLSCPEAARRMLLQ